jgi:hypothetical protein
MYFEYVTTKTAIAANADSHVKTVLPPFVAVLKINDTPPLSVFAIAKSVLPSLLKSAAVIPQAFPTS